MLSFDIRTLSEGPVQVDSTLAADDPVWMEGDTLPLRGTKVEGRISGAGSGRYYFSGSHSGAAAGECRRCLTPVEYVVQGSMQLIYVDADDETGVGHGRWYRLELGHTKARRARSDSTRGLR